MNWLKVEKIIGENIPKCIKEILSHSGYDNITSLNNISLESIEKYINEHGRDLIRNLDCCHHEFYKKQISFKFLPGHSDFLLNLSKHVSKCMSHHAEACAKSAPKQNGSFNKSTGALKLAEKFNKEKSGFSIILKELILTALQNENCNRPSYSDIIRYFATYIYLVGGRSCYEVLCQNLPLPSRSTILRYISDNKSHVVEGDLRCKELGEFLDAHKTKKNVWIAEDATAIVSKINYDPKTNQLVGVILPTNKNGCPITYSFKATNAETIKQYVKEPKARNVYVVVAQALNECVPPFILQIYGSNGSFTACDTVKRWHHMKLELMKYGIELAGISADGDPKILSAMVYEASLLKEIGIPVTQDMIHAMNKGRNRMLKENIKLPMGTHSVSILHLRQLLSNVHKSVHGLSYTDVFPTDRMNYGSFEKITKDRVITSLQNHIPDSNATVQYLSMFRDIGDSFLKFDLKPLDRVHLIYRAVFFLRIWRKFIKSSRYYNLKDNFITYNNFMCIEINSRYMVSLMKFFRDRNTPEQFLPCFFDSQACEKLFRLFRSMGTTQFTKINFSLLELIHMIARMEVQINMTYCKLNIDGIVLPHKRNEKTTIYELPTDKEICAEIEVAKKEAFETALIFGMLSDTMIDTNEIDEFELKSRLRISENDEEDDEELIEELYEQEDGDIERISENSDQTITEFYDELQEEIIPDSNTNSTLIQVMDENGLQKTIPKSTYVWMITEPSAKLSNDRLRRFKLKSIPDSTGNKRKSVADAEHDLESSSSKRNT